MSAYYWLVVLSLLSALVMHGERKGNTKYILVAAALMFCVMGLRDGYTVGNDSTSSYLHQFQRMGDKEWSDIGGPFDWVQQLGDQSGKKDKNPGLQYIMKLTYDWTGGDYQVLISVISFIAILANAHLIRRYSPNPMQSILFFFGLLFFPLHFDALKQSIAMAFIIFSFDAIVDRRPLRFLILVLSASIFHYPALSFLPAYWIGNMRLGKNYLVLLATMLVVVYLFRNSIVEWMSDVYYGENSDHAILFNANFLMNKVIVMLVIIGVAIAVRPPDPLDRIYCVLLALIGVATVLQTFAGYGNVFERLADYYFQFSIVFIPMVFENVKTKRQYLQPRTVMSIRNYGPFIFCAFAIWRFLDVIGNNANLNHFQFFF